MTYRGHVRAAHRLSPTWYMFYWRHRSLSLSLYTRSFYFWRTVYKKILYSSKETVWKRDRMFHNKKDIVANDVYHRRWLLFFRISKRTSNERNRSATKETRRRLNPPPLPKKKRKLRSNFSEIGGDDILLFLPTRIFVEEWTRVCEKVLNRRGFLERVFNDLIDPSLPEL